MDRRLGLSDGWTRANIGVDTRYECIEPENLLTMSRTAIESAMRDASIGWGQVDYLIDCSTSKVRPIPNNACHVQQAIGPDAQPIPCVDVQATCLGSIVALNLANGLFATQGYRHIVIFVAERAMAGVKKSEPESAGLVGDGAAAIVLKFEKTSLPFGFQHQTFGDHLELCRVDGGGHHLPFYEYSQERDEEFRFTMDGPKVFRVARKHLPPMVEKLIQTFYQQGEPSQLQVIPHQASPAAVEAMRRAIRVTKENYHVGIREMGNLAAASIPVMLDRLRCARKIQSGQDLMLLGTSAGYSQAALIFQL